MLKANDIKYEAINGNENIYRVKVRSKKTGYVHLDKKQGTWIYTPLDGGEHTTGATRTIAVGRYLTKK